MDTLLLEKIKPSDVNLLSFEAKSKLNPKIWKKNKLNPEVKKHLLQIADDFFESLDIPWVKVKDVRFTGSLANYNWSEYSDIDLHIIIDYKDVEDNSDLVFEYLKLKSDVWNEKHKVNIYDYDIEVYVQDENEPHASSGVYSIENDEWLVKPSKDFPELDKENIKKKAAKYINKIDDIQSLYDEGKYKEVLEKRKKLWDEIKNKRASGLKRSGEFSTENIIFKILRRGKYAEQLHKLKIKAYDALNSL